jgi:hypothetical protein
VEKPQPWEDEQGLIEHSDVLYCSCLMNNTYDYTRIHSLHSQQAQQNQRNTSNSLHPVSVAAMKNRNEKGPKITV